MPSDSTAFIPLCVPDLSGREGEYLARCVESGWVSTAGPFVQDFEAALARYLGRPEAVAVQSGTAALHLALLTLGVGPGDLVPVSTLTFIAPANAVRYCGATPLFVDAEPGSWQMDLGKLEAFLSTDCEPGPGGLRHRESGLTVRVLLPVHIMGGVVDMTRCEALAQRFGLRIIEDATEALGATWNGRPAGTLGDIGCFSFNGNKLVTAGGGGAVVARDPVHLARIRHLSTQAKVDGAEYVHDAVGFNYRLTSIQAAVGRAQLERIGDFLAAKARIAGSYQKAFAGHPGIAFGPPEPAGGQAWWMSAATLTAGRSRIGSRDLIAKLREAGIETRPLWQPIHQSPAHQPALSAGACTVADALYANGLCLPCSAALTVADQDRVIDKILVLV